MTESTVDAFDNASHRPNRRARRAFLRFKRSQDGSTAVEFGLIALPFFGLVFAIMEQGLVMWSSQVLETAVSNASRNILTGQIQGASTDATIQRDRFKELICQDIKGLLSCSDIYIDVRTFKSYADASANPLPPLVKNGELNVGEFVFQPSVRSDIVVVRAAAAYKVIVPTLDASQYPLKNNERLVAAVSSFRNEPF